LYAHYKFNDDINHYLNAVHYIAYTKITKLLLNRHIVYAYGLTNQLATASFTYLERNSYT